MSKHVVFLQNSWSPVYAGRHWPRESWLRALERSRSGKKLKIMIGDDLSVVHNTTLEVGPTASSICKPDLQHMSAVLFTERPKLVIACGRQAEKAVSEVWDGSLIVVPHPACRWLRDEFYERVRKLINLFGSRYFNHVRVRCWQEKGQPFKIINIDTGEEHEVEQEKAG